MGDKCPLAPRLYFYRRCVNVHLPKASNLIQITLSSVVPGQIMVLWYKLLIVLVFLRLSSLGDTAVSAHCMIRLRHVQK